MYTHWPLIHWPAFTRERERERGQIGQRRQKERGQSEREDREREDRVDRVDRELSPAFSLVPVERSIVALW